MNQEASPGLSDLSLDQQTASYLGETAKWAKFLSIIGFIFCGLIALFSLFAGSIFSAAFSRFGVGEGGFLGGTFISIIYIGAALLYFFPCLFLFHFSTKMQTALRTMDRQQWSDAFRNLKSCFKFVGILTIVMLSFYLLILVIAIIVAGLAR